MENSIEEDIKRIEYIFEFQNKMSCQYVLETEDEKAIEHILSDYKRVLKENEEKTTILLAGAEKVKQLEKENEELKADNYELNNRITDLLENIPIQKVKDKMEELNKEIKNAEVTEAIFKIKQQQILQELIEEREKEHNGK